MTRLINPTPQFLDGNGDPLHSGLLYFYEAGTSTFKATYADAEETIANTNPVELDAAGRVPSIFYTGLSRIVLKDANGLQIWDRDNVGSGSAFEPFGEWQNFIEYDVNDFVFKGGLIYQSRTNANQNNDPSSNPGANENWVEVRFVETYNSTVVYAIGDVVRTSGGSLWRSLTGSNIANLPTTDNGTNWIPAVKGDVIPEIITLNDRTTKGIVQSGGGALTALRVNILTDTQTYSLPSANSVAENQSITVETLDQNKTETPTVQRSGSDTIAYSGDTDTEILFNSGSSVSLTLYSNGSNQWRL